MILPQFFLYWKKFEVSGRILALVKSSSSALKKIRPMIKQKTKNKKNTTPVRKKFDNSMLALNATLCMPLRTRILFE